MKAETSSHMKYHTHIVKRISYNLFFESVRQPGQQAYISSLDNAIRCNQKYLDGCTQWIKALEEGTKHSYGVHDEIRASAFVVLELLQVVMERVSTTHWVSPFVNCSTETQYRHKPSLDVIPLYGSLLQPFLCLLCDSLQSCKTFTANLLSLAHRIMEHS